MIPLQSEKMDLLTLTPNGLRMALDLFLLRIQPLLELHLVALAVAEAS
jgi:hypothetical protein